MTDPIEAARFRAIARAVVIPIGVLVIVASIIYGVSLSSGNPKVAGPTVVTVPAGTVVCFEPWVWDRLDELRFMIAHGPGAGKPYPCSKAEVFARTCKVQFDRFWFEPVKGMTLPKHWFVPTGTANCGPPR